jgi:hypothetical protein
LNLLFHCTHHNFINHRRLAALQIIMHILASFIKVSHPCPYHSITHSMFSMHLTKLAMNVSRFHVSCIQETDYRLHFTCGGLLDFLEHCKHTGWCINMVQLTANGVRAAAAVFANELILWIRLVVYVSIVLSLHFLHISDWLLCSHHLIAKH